MENKEENCERIKRRAKALFQQSPYPTMLWNLDLKATDVNEAMLLLTGYSREQVLSMNVRDFSVISASGEGFQEAIRYKRTADGEASFTFPSGRKDVERHTVPLLNNTGEIEEILTIYRDVTEERKNLAEIRQNELNFQQMGRYMEQEVEGLGKAYAKVAEGDLTVVYDLTPPDEVTQAVYGPLKKLQTSVRQIITNLKTNLGDVNQRMENLASTVHNVNQNLGEASKGVQQIATNTTEVSGNTRKVAQGFYEVTKAMQDMSAAVEEITSSMESVSSLSKQTNDLSVHGAALAKETEKSMGDITSTSNRVYDIVLDVEKQMVEITKIVGIIRELANQTNLLALNAAIEAARAGEAGRGFAVVATEVKSLAQESRTSAERIEDMIGGLKESTQNASAAMQESTEMVRKGGKNVNETLHAFNEIVRAIDTITKSAAEVAAATQQQAATTQEITASVTEISGLVDRTSQEAENIAATTEESAAALDEISKIVTVVDSIAVEVTQVNRKFKLN
jgi:methyl-accepting chemotaxis protein